MSTFFPGEGDVVRKWHIVDATDHTLGRLSSRVARILAGKENPQYTPFIDTGDHVIIINAAKVKLTGLKAEKKVYHRYTGYPGGLRSEEFLKLFSRRPERVGAAQCISSLGCSATIVSCTACGGKRGVATANRPKESPFPALRAQRPRCPPLPRETEQHHEPAREPCYK